MRLQHWAGALVLAAALAGCGSTGTPTEGAAPAAEAAPTPEYPSAPASTVELVTGWVELPDASGSVWYRVVKVNGQCLVEQRGPVGESIVPSEEACQR